PLDSRRGPLPARTGPCQTLAGGAPRPTGRPCRSDCGRFARSSRARGCCHNASGRPAELALVRGSILLAPSAGADASWLACDMKLAIQVANELDRIIQAIEVFS